MDTVLVSTTLTLRSGLNPKRAVAVIFELETVRREFVKAAKKESAITEEKNPKVSV